MADFSPRKQIFIFGGLDFAIGHRLDFSYQSNGEPMNSVRLAIDLAGVAADKSQETQYVAIRTDDPEYPGNDVLRIVSRAEYVPLGDERIVAVIRPNHPQNPTEDNQ